MAGTTGYV